MAVKNIMYRLKIGITFIIITILTGCADHTDTVDVSHNQDSVRVEQTAYQKTAEQETTGQRLADRETVDPESVEQDSAFHADFVYGSYIYEIWGEETEPYAVITGVTEAYSVHS